MGQTTTRSALDQAIAVSRRGTAMARELRMEGEPASELTGPLLDAVALFEGLGIGYALIGGLAAMVYGRQRFTVDVDFVATPDHEAVLSRHGDAMRAHGFDPACTWKLYHTTGGEVDLWKDEHAAGIVARARVATLAGRPVCVADPHDLIAMKLRADRPQDDYDIAEIVRHTPIDDAVVQDRVTPEQFARYHAIRHRIGHV